jgi:hypothetical protein
VWESSPAWFGYVDARWRPMANLVFCHGHGRLRVETRPRCGRSRGLEVRDSPSEPPTFAVCQISTSSLKVTVIPSHAGSGLLRIAPTSPENSGSEATFAYAA